MQENNEYVSEYEPDDQEIWEELLLQQEEENMWWHVTNECQEILEELVSSVVSRFFTGGLCGSCSTTPLPDDLYADPLLRPREQGQGLVHNVNVK